MADSVNLSDPQSAALALLAQSFQRSQQQQPLFQAANQGMFQMLPGFAKQGIDPSAITNTPMPTMNGGSGGMNPLLSALLGGAAGGAASQIPFDKIAQAIKNLFSHGGSVQGNKPYPGGVPPSFGSDPTQFGGWDPTVSDPSGNPYLPSDPGVWYGDTGSGAFPTDPSGGSGTGPGMDAFYQDSGGDY